MSLMSVADLATMLQVSREKIYRLKDEIGFVRIGASIRFTRAAVDAYLASRTFGVRRSPEPTIRLPRLVKKPRK